MNTDQIAITLDFTPNPNTLKFVVNRSFLERGAANFTDVSKTEFSPLAKKMFGIPGVQAVMIGTNFVTITKASNGNWDVLAEEVPKTIEMHLQANLPAFDASYVAEAPVATSASSAEHMAIEEKIREVLDNEIRPAVAMDGGDIIFGKFEDGIVYLQLQGSCSSCPSSVATLKMGVESRLRDVIPEVKEVVQM